MTARRLLVTGANGFVGSSIVKALSERGRHAVALVREGRSCPALPGITWRSIARFDEAELTGALGDVDGVIHAASVVHRPDASLATYEAFNREGTRALCAACRARGVGRIVFMSTIKVYGEATVGIIDESTPVGGE